jgi:hypothetical protein
MQPRSMRKGPARPPIPWNGLTGGFPAALSHSELVGVAVVETLAGHATVASGALDKTVSWLSGSRVGWFHA